MGCGENRLRLRASAVDAPTVWTTARNGQ